MDKFDLPGGHSLEVEDGNLVIALHSPKHCGMRAFAGAGKRAALVLRAAADQLDPAEESKPDKKASKESQPAKKTSKKKTTKKGDK